jgi:hypothetical protein
LPDFSWYKIPKLEKYAKLPRTIPNVDKICITKDRKMDQASIKYTIIFHCTTLQIYPNLAFWFENKPSGNPGDLSDFRQYAFE